MSARPTPPPKDTRDALGLAPTRGARERASTSSSSSPGSPPVLRTGLWSGIKLLVLMNILPLFGLGWLAWGWWHGRVAFRNVTPDHVVAIAAIVVACALVAVSAWLVMPVARWLRDYPRWHFRHVSRLRWFLPTVGGWVFWIALWLASAAAIAFVALVVAKKVWQITHAGA